MSTAIFTIASRNYFAFVRTLMNSLEKTNPEYERYVCVCDKITEDFSSMPYNFSMISLQDLELPHQQRMIFRYTILELNTAVKPFVIKHLMNMGYDRVIYVDPDICTYRRFEELEDAFNADYDIILTPHLTGICNDDKLPNDLSIMQAGVYNLGFVALKNTNNVHKLIEWWCGKLEYDCVVDIPRGVFVDQKYMDLTPGMFEKVFILRHEGYNVAYWNLSHRKAEKQSTKFFFNGQELAFFHYSGLNPKNIENISKHQNRYDVHNIGISKELFEEYAKAVLSNDFEMYQKFQYSYGVFDNGMLISDLMRYAYRMSEKIQKLMGENPYEEGERFYAAEIKNAVVNEMLTYVWSSRPDVQEAFPGKKDMNYINWFLHSVVTEYNLPKNYLDDIQIRPKTNGSVLRTGTLKEKIKFKIKQNVSPATLDKIWRIYRRIRHSKGGEAYTINIGAQTRNTPKGVNLIGYIKSEHGVGEAARHMADCLDKMEINWQIYDFEVGNLSRQADVRWQHKIGTDFPYQISIFSINADQMPVAYDNLPKKLWEGYIVGVWYWELPEFPDEWLDSFALVNEIWAPTKFIAESISMKSNKPVIYMPPAMKLEQPDCVARGDFGLPENAFLYLNMYDSLSVSGRKNPKAVFDAFKAAFKPDDMTVGLVVKVNNNNIINEDKMLRDMIAEYKNIYIIADILTRNQINELICVCDVAVSLHRSEGLGLMCQEAMYFGKPVIATNWSGNTDFMRPDNSCLVNADLIEIGQDMGPYKAWQKWAEPDIKQAAEYMIRIKEDEEYYRKIAQNAELTIKNEFSPEVCARRMKTRLEYIENIFVNRMGRTNG